MGEKEKSVDLDSVVYPLIRVAGYTRECCRRVRMGNSKGRENSCAVILMQGF